MGKLWFMLMSLHLWAVASGSMGPAIPQGSLVLTEKKANYNIGEIITYRLASKTTITHRIVKKVDGDYITRGDANNVADGQAVRREQIIGAVILSIPWLGYLHIGQQIFWHSIFGLFFLYFVLAFFVYRLWVIFRKAKWKILAFLWLWPLMYLIMGHLASTNALFSDQGVSGNNIFAAGDWERPQSTIDDVQDASGNSIDMVTNKQVQVIYQAQDSFSGVARVELWYSYNNGAWQYYGNGDNGTADFSFPSGDGIYRLVTVAVDNAGLIEDKNGNGVDDNSSSLELDLVAGNLQLNGSLTEIEYDTQPPTVALSITDNGNDVWQGKSVLPNGDFKQGMAGWTAGGDGDHHVVAEGKDLDGNPVVADKGGQMFELGFRSQDKTGKDFLKREVTIPASAVPYLQFNYRMLSEDTVDYDQFAVAVESQRQGKKVLLKTGSEENDDLYNGDSWAGWQGDSDWRHLNSNLQNFQGDKVKLVFQLQSHKNKTGPGRSWAYISNVDLRLLDPRLTQDASLSLDVHDASGSGTDTAEYTVNDDPVEEFDGTPVVLPTGEAKISARAIDLAANTSQPAQMTAKVESDVVLNRFSAAPSSGDEWVELYNNSELDSNVDGWQICDSLNQCVTLSAANADGGDTNIAAGTSRRFNGNFNLNNDGDTLVLKNDIGDEMDRFNYPTFGSHHDQIWSRNPNGLGSWQLSTASIGANITSRYNAMGKILLSVFNIPADYDHQQPLEYEITYEDDHGLAKGIAGQILAAEVADGKADREFYLGTCSSGGTCVMNIVPSHTVKLTLRQGATVIISEKDFPI